MVVVLSSELFGVLKERRQCCRGIGQTPFTPPEGSRMASRTVVPQKIEICFRDQPILVTIPGWDTRQEVRHEEGKGRRQEARGKKL
jgi:hypothetical protein